MHLSAHILSALQDSLTICKVKETPLQSVIQSLQEQSLKTLGKESLIKESF